MTYVIAEPCIGTKDASCVDVCPVDCIHSTDADEQYFIDPDECIDCGACEPACPVSAIFPEDSVPDNWTDYIAKNADYFKKQPVANAAAVLPDRLVDSHGRRLGDLRISVTDRCNFRCTYCIPKRG